MNCGWPLERATACTSPRRETRSSCFSVAATKVRRTRIFAKRKPTCKTIGDEIMAKRSSDYRKGLIERLKKDPEFQVEYLKASLEENSDMPEAILMALRDIAEARGFEQLAEAADLSQKSLYKILSDTKDAKPRFETIVKLLNALGLRLTVEERPHAS